MRPLLFLLALPAVYAQNGTVDGATCADWPHYGGTQLSWRYSALDQINTTNVKNLAPAWIFQTGDYAENLQSTPIVVDGVMYVITPRAQVSALDAATGLQQALTTAQTGKAVAVIGPWMRRHPSQGVYGLSESVVAWPSTKGSALDGESEKVEPNPRWRGIQGT